MIMLDEASTVVAGGMENLSFLRTSFEAHVTAGNSDVHLLLKIT